ncbi:MAG: hypothetical protein M1834_001854 [Cirrosporium novae-zelandiae]|nr:MAG: hypothetical protein M1834_001854 [Cirrosporium novae-zelandiae]
MDNVAYLKRSDSSPTHTNGPTAKRKLDDDGHSSSTPATRSKRQRYTSVACNECKRRKIKCNGETPCGRCGHLNLACEYAPNCCSNGLRDSEEFGQMKAHLAALQDQVDTLFNNLSTLRNDYGASPSTAGSNGYRPGSRSLTMSQPLPQDLPSPQRARTNPPRFRGPTSSAFNLDVAKSSLQTMGITQPGEALEDGFVTRDGSPAPVLIPHPGPEPHFGPIHPGKDPLWMLTRDEAIRLCRVFEEEILSMYPILEPAKVVRQASMLFTFMEAAVRSGFTKTSMPGSDGMDDDDTNMLKMILAVALTMEGKGKSELGQKLFESVRPHAEAKLWEPTSIKGLTLHVMVSIYYFQLDDEIQAWRIVGIPARMCLEMGLHRREVLVKTFTTDEDYAFAARLFWAVCCLDRRWSFGTGMPFVIQDTDIDPLLPEPDPTYPYLRAMIAYNRLGSRVWNSVSTYSNTLAPTINADELNYLDYQVLQWHKSVPSILQYPPVDSPITPHRQIMESPRTLHRLRVLLHLRANQMRILIYRPVLHSPPIITSHPTLAATAVDIARDTIRVLSTLHQTSSLYTTQQQLFNYFLLSALAVLFLAVAHAPHTFNEVVRQEFYMALDLVRGFERESYISKRLWRTIRGLKGVMERLGVRMQMQQLPPPAITPTSAMHQQHPGMPITNNNVDESDPHSSAALTMAGLATSGQQQAHTPLDPYPTTTGPGGSTPQPYPPSRLPSFSLNIPSGGLTQTSMDGPQMTAELTSLFEAAGAIYNSSASVSTVTAPGGPTSTSTPTPTPESTGFAPPPPHSQGQGGEWLTTTATAAVGSGVEGIPAIFASEEELMRILRELF